MRRRQNYGREFLEWPISIKDCKADYDYMGLINLQWLENWYSVWSKHGFKPNVLSNSMKVGYSR